MNSKILNKNIKFTFVFSLIIIVISIFISIGYATVTVNMFFNTMVDLGYANNLQITSVTCTADSGMSCTGSITGVNTIGANGSGGPNGYHTYTITVQNKSSVDKQITNVSWGGATISVYQNNTPLNQRIKPGASKTFTIKLDMTGKSGYGGGWTFTFANYTITKMVDYDGASNYLGCTNINKDKIESIQFQTSLSAPSGTVQTCNVGVNSSANVKAFAKDADSDNLYEVYIGSKDGEVFAGQATHIANSLSKLTTINMTNYNTKYTTSMENMFRDTPLLKTIILGSTFDTTSVTITKHMFLRSGVSELNLTALNTNKVTNTHGMFAEMPNVITINLRGSFTMNSVTNCPYMFKDDPKLTTIYAVSSKWQIPSSATSTNMFYNVPKLKGGNGTAYSSSHTDKTYARIDTSSTPGYLTS